MSAVVQIDSARSRKANERAHHLMRILAAKFADEGTWAYFAAMKWLEDQIRFSAKYTRRGEYVEACVRTLEERFGVSA